MRTRIHLPLVASLAGLALTSACAAIVGIDDVPDGPEDAGVSPDAIAPFDAASAADVTVVGDEVGPLADARVADGAPDADAALPTSSFTYSGAPFTLGTDDNQHAITGIAVSSDASLVAVTYNANFAFFTQSDGGYGTAGNADFETPHDLVFDLPEYTAFVQHGAGKSTYKAFTDIGQVKPVAPPFIAVPDAGATEGECLALASGSSGHLFMGATLDGTKPAVAAFGLDQAHEYLGRIITESDASIVTSAVASDPLGDVIAVITAGNLYISSLADFSTTSTPRVPATPLGATAQLVAVDSTGTSVFVLVGDTSASQTLLQLQEGSNGWSVTRSEPVPGEDVQLPSMAVSRSAIIVSPGRNDNDLVEFGIAGGVIVSRSAPRAFGSLDGINGVSLSAEGTVLGISTASGAYVLFRD